jgi:hypothetical protein
MTSESRTYGNSALHIIKVTSRSGILDLNDANIWRIQAHIINCPDDFPSDPMQPNTQTEATRDQPPKFAVGGTSSLCTIRSLPYSPRARVEIAKLAFCSEPELRTFVLCHHASRPLLDLWSKISAVSIRPIN